jgi:hypothetical protein
MAASIQNNAGSGYRKLPTPFNREDAKGANKIFFSISNKPLNFISRRSAEVAEKGDPWFLKNHNTSALRRQGRKEDLFSG